MTAKWTHLTYSDLAESLAEDEIEKLNSMSLSGDIEDICQQQLDSVADAFRGAFESKGYNVDVRPHYISNGYRMFVLAVARYYICTRFPNSEGIFLDKPRQELFNKALELLKDPYIGTDEPDYSDVPELSALGEREDAAITLPWQRLVSRPGRYGFSHPYLADYQLSGYIY